MNVQNEVEKKCLDLLLKAMTFNFSKTRQEITGDKPTLFVDFSGHTNALYVNICPFGWTEKTIGKNYIVYLDDSKAVEKLTEIENDIDKVIGDYKCRFNETFKKAWEQKAWGEKSECTE